MTEFAERVVEERLRLAEEDPPGEAEAAAPVRRMTQEDWDRIIAETPLGSEDAAQGERHASNAA